MSANLRKTILSLLNNTTVLGSTGTVIYLITFIIIRWSTLDTISTLPLNELGDFLSGVFAPLAFFWLILGFKLQKDELKQNTQALEMQAAELKNMVETSKLQAEALNVQANADMRTLLIKEQEILNRYNPMFILQAPFTINLEHANVRNQYFFQIINTGRPVMDTSITASDSRLKVQDNGIVTDHTTTGNTTIFWNEQEAPPERITFSIRCQKLNGEPYSTEIVVEKNIDDIYMEIKNK